MSKFFPLKGDKIRNLALRIYHSIEEFEAPNKPVVTTGTFDGVHIGHRTIINHLNTIAEKIGGESVLLTFWPHPRQVLYQDTELKLIQTLEERVESLADAGIEHLIVHPFTLDFSRKSSLEFIRDILVAQLQTEKLVIGYDHHFGRNREGSFEHLKEYAPVYGFDLEEIPAFDVDQVNVSSTKVREALLQGDIKTANKYLGGSFSLAGIVEHGDQIGRKIGYPTANIKPTESYKLIPAQGVYAVEVKAEGKMYKGMLNIGNRLTVYGKDLRIEVHLFGFEGNLYNKRLEIKFLHYLRADQKFDSLEALKEQLHKDADHAKSVL